ncbi:P-loop containing nucleoside triphosphate hydrolase protein [Thamnocephalis sphaerospora]|uniref:P-loop containing nucleoside triphosphate hydrolase protein n=1 Tax=Thamnocephalis sphaerospora TaxID=78915 RepID=A0A4P9XTI5_9FUNG|nr:P-loop containing nucleoside triphosphate hydrolase protein [Thamnocephalis sphaerospora]|eukprot:RKP09485.1 P-loop containing nucleoside triphosphate hydrolase protein [Thamnocephalis sphaerospora]
MIVAILATRGHTELTESGRIITLEESASFFEWMTFDWLTPLMLVGKKRRIDDEDLWDLCSRDKAGVAAENYSKHRRVCMLRRTTVLRRLLAAFRRDLFIQVIFITLWSLSLYAVPFFMRLLLEYLEDPNHYTRWEAWLFVAGLFIGTIVTNTLAQHAEAIGQHMAVRARAIISHQVSEKCMRRRIRTIPPSSTSKGDEHEMHDPWDAGAVMNLLNVDVQNISEMLISLPSLIGGPLQSIIASAVLWYLVGISAVLILVILAVTILFIAIFLRKISSIYGWVMDITDERLSVVSEMLQLIRAVKLFTWEQRFLQCIDAARKRELDANWIIQLLNAGMLVCIDLGPSAALGVCMGIYTVVLGYTLTASVAFTALALVSILRMALLRTPQAISWATQARVSSRRISEFLASPEIGDGFGAAGVGATTTQTVRIAIQDAAFCWTPPGNVAISMDASANAPSFQLQNINVEFLPGELNIIAGPTGSGKTSLLLALLGEMPRTQGCVYLPRHYVPYNEHGAPTSNIAYVAQQAWLQNLSIRDNILFGQPFNHARYQQVLYACALKRDIEALAAGDRTQIGERGITLSGGQKQRVALARAVYSPADHLLLDDCLSAVDARTAQHIVDNCLLGPPTHGRTRILVTHQFDLCIHGAALAVLMDHGCIAAEGPADEVLPILLASENGSVDDAPVGDADVAVDSEQERRFVDVGTSTDDSSLFDVSTVSECDGIIVDEEERAEGRISTKSYAAYVRATGGYGRWVAIVFAFASVSSVTALQIYSLEVWTNEKKRTLISNLVYTGLYLVGTVGFAGLTILAYYMLYTAAYQASHVLHKQLTEKVVGARLRFFDRTPIGRIMNRFSKDVSTVDQEIPDNIAFFLSNSAVAIFALLVVAVILPWFALAIIVIVIVSGLTAKVYLATSRELKRLESISKSPFLSLATEILDGAVTIRAFGMEHWFALENTFRVDALNRPTYLLKMTNQWLVARLQWIAALAVLACCTLILTLDQAINSGAAGFALTYVLIFPIVIAFLFNRYGRVEISMNAMERIGEYLEIKQEAADAKGRRWPHRGAIRMEHFSVKYDSNYTPALYDLTLDIKPGERIGVVGRTGAGKSTLSVAFFRFLKVIRGRIVIDDVDIAQIGLHDLRSRLTIIPQEPVLFSGTIRDNLDPAREHSDAHIWAAMHRCQLIDAHSDEAHPPGLERLDAVITENGANFSHGQRQLLALSRALLHGSKVIIMDEATASVDPDTDAKIQTTIRNEFPRATMICITHRLRSVIDCDRILVLDGGRAVEFDTPLNLISRVDGAFRQLCEHSGEFDVLLAMVQGTASSIPALATTPLSPLMTAMLELEAARNSEKYAAND